MTLYACLNVYQEEQLLPDCLRSIRTILPQAKIILIDGAYVSWVRQVKIEAAVEMSLGNTAVGEDMLARFTSAGSTDRTIEIAKEFGVEHIVMPQTQCMCGGKRFDYGYYEKGAYLPWPSEWEKRAKFFEFGRDGDYYFVVDADERLEGKMSDALTEEQYAVMLQRDDDFAPYPVPRIYRHQPGIKMQGAHMAVWVDRHTINLETGKLEKQPRLLSRKNVPILPGIKIRHIFNERGTRDQVRHMAKGAYYRNGLKKEEEDFRREHDL